jgi:hypothetical protein
MDPQERRGFIREKIRDRLQSLPAEERQRLRDLSPEERRAYLRDRKPE